MHPRSLRLLVVVHALSLVVFGCNNAPPTAPVTGTVTFDGSPLQDGIVEMDAGDGTPPLSLEIQNGQFAGDVLLGKKTLRFFAMRPPKKDPSLSPSDVQPPLENVLPNRYGYDSSYAIDVPPDGLSDLKYELVSD